MDYLALVGHTSDNVAGVPECGPKTALKWLADKEEETPKVGSNGKPRWDGSPAEQFLRVAVADGDAFAMKPAVLHRSESVYKGFDGKVFRNHIYQERQTQKYVKNKFPKSHEAMVEAARIFKTKYDSDDDA